MSRVHLGVCYYPEHWPEDRWADDARRMADLGLTYVRIGEFAWSRLEPQPGHHAFDWLDRAIGTLGEAGLKVVLGTPTATPPKWLVDGIPSMIPVDRDGKPRGFGSRRHYCFSSADYAAECKRIVAALARRYGENPYVAGWQTDNEYGWADTARCYCPGCRDAFRRWLAGSYPSVDALNDAWGNVFWSMEYRSFDEIELPTLTVGETNPAHRMDFYRFCSDQVVAFNRRQVSLLRRYSPGRFITHNYMGFVTDFDHYAVAADMDVASWDSYPLGFLDQAMPAPAEVRRRYAGTGHPDVAAFHHDLYRAVGRGRWWVMEQQPGPVNWAWHNAIPKPGMVRLWTWEAFAHGAETVSYFRWRQAPFAQEQMHAGLMRSDFRPAPGLEEVRDTAGELDGFGWDLPGADRAPVAFLFDYQSEWACEIQPHAQEYSYKFQAFAWYSALRRLGLDVDFVRPGDPLDGYRLIVVNALVHVSPEAAAQLSAAEAAGAVIAVGPRTGSRTADMRLPDTLAPGPLNELLGLTVARVETLRPDIDLTVEWNGRAYTARLWREETEGRAEICARFSDGSAAVLRNGRSHYMACLPDEDLLIAWFDDLAREAGLETTRLPEDVRLRTRGDVRFAFNLGDTPWRGPAGDYVLGGPEVPPQGVAAWRIGS